MSGVGDARQLSGAALRGLLARLDADGERAVTEYESLRHTLQQFFTWRNALDPDACADETLDRVARKLHEGAEVDRLRPFVFGVARLVLHEEHRRVAAQPARLTDGVALPAGDPAVDEDANVSLADCLDRCLAALPPGDRNVVLRYYRSDGRGHISGRADLARELGVTAEALRSRVQRLRNRLEACTTACRQDGATPARKDGPT